MISDLPQRGRAEGGTNGWKDEGSGRTEQAILKRHRRSAHTAEEKDGGWQSQRGGLVLSRNLVTSQRMYAMSHSGVGSDES